MSRSAWKIPYISNMFFNKFIDSKDTIKIWSRSSTIPKNSINKKFRIYNGIWALSVVIKSNMIGHKFGEFSATKRMGRDIHFKKRSKKRK